MHALYAIAFGTVMMIATIILVRIVKKDRKPIVLALKGELLPPSQRRER